MTADPRVEAVALTGDYANTADYARMCVPCHRKGGKARGPLPAWPVPWHTACLCPWWTSWAPTPTATATTPRKDAG